MSDIFEDREDLLPHRKRLFDLIDATPWLTWLLLTKRPENIAPLMKIASAGTFGTVWNFHDHMPNVWLGTTVEDQARAEERIPARVRFLSCEPLLEKVSLNQWLLSEHGRRHIGAPAGLHWIITGGESGHGARPMQVEWAESLKDQCAAAGVAFFMKQLGGARDARHDIEQFPSSLQIRQFPTP